MFYHIICADCDATLWGTIYTSKDLGLSQSAQQLLQEFEATNSGADTQRHRLICGGIN